MSKDSRRNPVHAGGLGFTLVALVLVFAGLGYVADRWLHTAPWLMVVGMFAGAGLGFAYLALVLFADSPGRERGRKGGDAGTGPGEGSTQYARGD